MNSHLPAMRPRALASAGSTECLVPSLPQDVDHGLEGKPLWDVFTTAEPAAELCARELDDLLPLLLGLGLLDIALLLADVHHVLVVRDGHAELLRVLLARLLGVVSAVEVVARDGALRARHVAADDEVRGAVILADDHVLDRLAGAGHLHAVRKVRPPKHRVL